MKVQCPNCGSLNIQEVAVGIRRFRKIISVNPETLRFTYQKPTYEEPKRYFLSCLACGEKVGGGSIVEPGEPNAIQC
jgi:hypothetical protein